jgi:hypothetical protein
MEITPNEMIVLIGYKDCEIFKLRQRIVELEQQLAARDSTIVT